MKPIKDVTLAVGKTDHRAFTKSGDGPTDWQFLTVDVDPSFQPSNDNAVVVIVTPNNRTHADNVHVVAPVVLAGPFTNGKFEIAARNADCADGEAGFNWMVLIEEAIADAPLVDLRIGTTQPQVLEKACETGDWCGWGPHFSHPLPAAPKDVAGLLTASFIGPTGHRVYVFDAKNVPKSVGISTTVPYADNPIAAQPVACDEWLTATAEGHAFMCRNTDDFRGASAVNWVAAVHAKRRHAAVENLVVDTGRANAQFLQAGSNQDAWAYWEVQFDRPFDAPPVVVATSTHAMDSWAGNLPQNAVPCVPEVLTTTRFGCTLVARTG